MAEKEKPTDLADYTDFSRAINAPEWDLFSFF